MARGWACVLLLSALLAQTAQARPPTLAVSAGAPLPERLVIGYQSWEECDDKAVKAVQQGVSARPLLAEHVLIWFAINLVSEGGVPTVDGGPDLACVANTTAWLRALGLPTVHLVSVGGWDAIHPTTAFSAEELYKAFDTWNRATLKGEPLFHGLDWDIEGHDNVTEPGNHFTAAELRVMGELSQLAKRDGYIVSLVPAESYLDPSLPDFSLSLLLDYPEWRELQPNFAYHGRNCYAYLLAAHGTTEVDDFTGGTLDVPTFDFVTVQLYESFSHARYALRVLNQSWPEYLSQLVRRFDAGWAVSFDQEPSVGQPRSVVRVPPSRLIIGLANGWAPGDKSLLIKPDELRAGHAELLRQGIDLRGYGWWDIKEEGLPVDGEPLYMAQVLGDIMRTREAQGGDAADASKAAAN